MDNKNLKKIPGGLLIVFEGIDGTGKTTQLELAHQALLKNGWDVATARNLGGTPIGEELRKVILSPLERPSATNLYISAAIQEALIGAIEDKRAQGKIILMDRGPLSLAAYEIYGSGLGESLGWPHVESGMARLKPELTILYTTDVKVALARARRKSAKADYFESQSESYFEAVAKGYEAASSRYKQVLKVDANRPVEDVQAETMRLISQAIKSASSASEPS